MSVSIHIVNPLEYYTNLDVIRGEVSFALYRPEPIGNVVVKLEGESSTTLIIPTEDDEDGWTYKNEKLEDLDLGRAPGTITRPAPGTVMEEKHKILYQVTQVYPKPDELPNNNMLPAGQYTFAFQFRLPFTNVCADPFELARSGGIIDNSGNAETWNEKAMRFGLGGSRVRVMDGSKQLLYKHVKKPLPPSFSGFMNANETTEIRYFIKATVQRPGMFKGNWRNTTTFKFLPIEPLRDPPSTREVFARRPFTFRERIAPSDAPALRGPKMKGVTTHNNSSSTLSLPESLASSSVSQSSLLQSSPSSISPRHRQLSINVPCRHGVAPSIQLIALLPCPAILTCNEPVPLRIVARKLEASHEEVLLTSLKMRLLGTTHLTSQDAEQTKTAAWVVMTRLGLSIPVCDPDAPVGSEINIPNDAWRDKALPNTVMPSFVTCNISREYQLEVSVGLTWSVRPLEDPTMVASEILPTDQTTGTDSGQHTKNEIKEMMREQKREQKAIAKAIKLKQALPPHLLPQTITLPLTFQSVKVYSGIKPNQMLVDAVAKHRERVSLQLSQRPNLDLMGQGRQHNYQQHPYPPHLNTGVYSQGAQQQYATYPHQHQNQHQNQRLLQQSPQQHRPRQGSAGPVFELSGEEPPVVPPRPDGSVYVSPSTPIGSSFPVAPPSVPGAVEMSGLPVIRRRPVPPQFVAQQREEQHRRQNREKFPLAAEQPSQAHDAVRRQGPQQQYHLYQQQTSVSPLYPAQLQPGEDPASLLSSPPFSSTPAGGSSGSDPSGGIVAQNGTVLVSYNGVVSSMVPAVAAAIDAFSFADGGDTASLYQEPPPSYDEVMAEIISSDIPESSSGDGDGGAAAMRPSFSGDAEVYSVSPSV